MRTRSVTGPVILVAIGVAFLISNLRPDFSPFALIAEYWPFLLIGAGLIGLVEVLFSASRGEGVPVRPVGGGWMVWVILWAIIAGVVGGHRNWHFNNIDVRGVNFLGSDYDYDLPSAGAPQVVSQGVTRVILDNLRGNISLKGDDSGDVKVTGHKSIRAYNRENADQANDQSRVVVEHQGDSLVIRTAEPGRRNAPQITNDLDITVPRGMSVEARGRTGDVTVDNIDGSLSVTAGRGDVRLSHIGKDVRIEASRTSLVRATDLRGSFDLTGRGSDLQLENIAGLVTINGDYSGTLEFRALAKPLRFESSRTEFHVEAVPGTITMDLSELKLMNVSGPVQFQTGTRDIEAVDVTNGLDLTVERGDIRVSSNKLPVSKIDVHSHHGDITVQLPDQAQFQLRGSTSQGEADTDFGAALHTQSHGRGATIEGQTGTGPQITLVTDRGTVSVKKL